MEVQMTNRGFQFVEFADANGEVCAAQISSALADTGGAYKLWLGAQKLHAKTWVYNPGDEYGKWVDIEIPPKTIGSNQIHLSFEGAVALRDLLNLYIESEGRSFEGAIDTKDDDPD